MYIICTAAPTGLDIVIDEQNYATITWEPPRLAKRHGKLINYSITCSTAQRGSTLTATTLNTTIDMWLEPYETYQCCASAVNPVGLGFSSCKLVATNEGGMLLHTTSPFWYCKIILEIITYIDFNVLKYCTAFGIHVNSLTHIIAPTAPPTNISWLMLNPSSVLLFWHAPPIEHQNGIIQGYHIELSRDNESVHYTTEGPYLVVDNLLQDTDYNCSVAAYTILMGPFSEPVILSLRLENHIVTTQTITSNLI